MVMSWLAVVFDKVDRVPIENIEFLSLVEEIILEVILADPKWSISLGFASQRRLS